MTPSPAASDALLGELRQLIATCRGRVAQAVNSELVLLHWQVGRRLREEILGASGQERAAYGEQVVTAVAARLAAEFGPGFGARNLRYMMRFAEVFPDLQIVNALRAQLSWTHLRELIALDDPLMRQFYTELCRLERWSTRTLKSKIAGMLFERTAIAKRPSAVVAETLDALRDEQRITPDLVFRDPYVLDFLGLPADYSEQDLEAAILRELEGFLYLRWLDRHERQPDENPPLGLILCADKNEEQIELLELTDGSVRVASYLTALPPRELLERKLLESIEHARARLAAPGGEAP